jgi:hypothetical protein
MNAGETFGYDPRRLPGIPNCGPAQAPLARTGTS